MKILYFDTETTGTDPKLHEITQLAMIVEIDGEMVAEANFRCQPTRWDTISEEAMAITGMNIEKYKELPPPSEMIKRVREIFDEYIDKFNKFDKFTPAGHNVGFDMDFLRAFWGQHGDKFYGSYVNNNALDSLAFSRFMSAVGILDVPNFKLGTLAEHYDLPLVAHDALNDIRVTREIIHKMMALLKN